LPEADLQPGDILFKKCFSLFEDIYAFGIGLGQIIGVRAEYGSRTSEHLMLAVCHPLPSDIIESDVDGVVSNRLDRGDHVEERIIIYRCVNQEVARLAVQLARQFMGIGRDPGQEPPGPGQIHPGSYDFLGGTAALLFRNRANNSGSESFLAKLHSFCAGTSNVRPNFVCSTFVAAIYELAASSLGLRNFMLNVDVKTMVPKAYEHHLNLKPNQYVRVGRVRGH
jgi:hypothetical protein